jgi:hypothetical protein
MPLAASGGPHVFPDPATLSLNPNVKVSTGAPKGASLNPSAHETGLWHAQLVVQSRSDLARLRRRLHADGWQDSDLVFLVVHATDRAGRMLAERMDPRFGSLDQGCIAGRATGRITSILRSMNLVALAHVVETRLRCMETVRVLVVSRGRATCTDLTITDLLITDFGTGLPHEGNA